MPFENIGNGDGSYGDAELGPRQCAHWLAMINSKRFPLVGDGFPVPPFPAPARHQGSEAVGAVTDRPPASAPDINKE